MDEVKLQTKEQGQLYQLSPYSPLYVVIKRGLDIIISILALSLLSSLVCFISILIMLDSPGSPFYIQERLGRNGKVFKMLKLRSMHIDAERNGIQWTSKCDSRITKIGSFIRKARIDELPQFIHVLKGEMSLVGPRPERAFFYETFEQSVSNFKSRLAVRPGLTGWAQVNGGYELDPKKKLELDLFYIEHASLRLDLIIMWKTISVIVTGKGAR